MKNNKNIINIVFSLFLLGGVTRAPWYDCLSYCRGAISPETSVPDTSETIVPDTSPEITPETIVPDTLLEITPETIVPDTLLEITLCTIHGTEHIVRIPVGATVAQLKAEIRRLGLAKPCTRITLIRDTTPLQNAETLPDGLPPLSMVFTWSRDMTHLNVFEKIAHDLSGLITGVDPQADLGRRAIVDYIGTFTQAWKSNDDVPPEWKSETNSEWTYHGMRCICTPAQYEQLSDTARSQLFDTNTLNADGSINLYTSMIYLSFLNSTVCRLDTDSSFCHISFKPNQEVVIQLLHSEQGFSATLPSTYPVPSCSPDGGESNG